jgi:predicted Zn-dependent protease
MNSMSRSLRLRYLTLGALLIGTALLAGCERTPAGRLQLALVPESIMTDMGTQAFADMRQQRPLVQHGTTPARVRCVLDRITDQVAAVYPEARAPAEWQIAVFDDASPNAFALPGGHVGVHSGLLNVASNNAQLAAVLGHEVAHMLADHGNERMTQKLGVNAVLLLIGLFADIDSAMVFQALGIGAELGITLPFSRAHEREADLMGLELMAAAGFDPAESVALWRNMARAGGDQPPEFLSTHPAHDNRIESLQAHLPAANRRFADAAIADCQ